MAVIFDATPNSPTGNSFATLDAAQDYWDTRLFPDMWEESADQEMALIQATRTLTAILSPRREYVRGTDGCDGYYIITPTWTGLPTTTTQRLPWGRTGMYDRNGNAIAGDVYPLELQEATAELAGQMSLSDRMVDSNEAVKGITSVKAGSVAVTFSGHALTWKVLPDSVLSLLVPSWLTDQVIESMYSAQFDVISS